MTVTDRPLRADAQRNREKLLAAATEAFAAEGEDVALESVAARAGLGIGTLYRHFPNRDALVVAAYRHEVDALCAAAADLLAVQPADEALITLTTCQDLFHSPDRSVGFGHLAGTVDK